MNLIRTKCLEITLLKLLRHLLSQVYQKSVEECNKTYKLGSPMTLVWPPGGPLPLWESVGMRRGFAPHFRHLDDLFAPQNFTMSTILFRSCWVPFRNPPFSACRRSFCPQNWPNLSFHSDLVGSHFELRAAHPYWFLPGVPPPGFGQYMLYIPLLYEQKVKVYQHYK